MREDKIIKLLCVLFIGLTIFSTSIEIFLMCMILFLAIIFFIIEVFQWIASSASYKRYLKKFVKSKRVRDRKKLQEIQISMENHK